jgi:lipopolysaccharide/colanic/teichoic acid biosynthesis glycosyltransferase
LRAFAEKLIAAIALIALSPLFLLIAAGILLTSPGTIFYLAERSGTRGAIFRMYKFRTMRFNAGGSRISSPADARVYPLGAFLRRFKLDELPQFINILKGEMQFVGPRPEDPWFVEHYYSDSQRETLAVPPGLTSPGTLYYYTHLEQFVDDADPEGSYTRGPLGFKLEMDRLWVRRSSLLLDLRLVLATVGILLGFNNVRVLDNFLPSQPLNRPQSEPDIRQ